MQDHQSSFTNRKYFVSTQGQTEDPAQSCIAPYRLRIGSVADVNNCQASGFVRDKGVSVLNATTTISPTDNIRKG